MQQLQELQRQVSALPDIECTCDLEYPVKDFCSHKGMVRKARIEDLIKSRIDELMLVMTAENEGMTTE